MSVLLDTNALIAFVNPRGTTSQVVHRALQRLVENQQLLQIVPQNLYELWAVATRPTGENGLGLSVTQAKAALESAKRMSSLLPDNSHVTAEWERLVFENDVKGKSAHDARLVAAMLAHDITQLLTFNGRDFSRYPGITILDPADLAR